ncbi:MAG: carbohydrate ABC transporter permease [Lachnospirales bacterium]
MKDKSHIIVYILLGLGAIIMLFPFIWMILTSLKTIEETRQIPPSFLPQVFMWSNYKEVFSSIPYATLYKNSFTVTVIVTAGQVFICSMAAYAFARLNFPLKNFLFFLVLTILMVPSQVYYLPQYIIMSKINFLDSLKAIIVPSLFSAYGTFLLRQFFISLPKEVEEAAIIDGCNRGSVFFRISVHLAKPGMISLAIFTMLFAWNDLLWPTLVINSPSKMTIPMGITLLATEHSTMYNLIMAGTALSTIPILIIFVIFQKQFVEGIALTGVKG